VVAALFLMLTLRSRRHIEYLVPTLMLFLAFVIDSAGRPIWASVGVYVRSFARSARPVCIMAAFALIGTFIVFAHTQLTQTKSDLANGYRFESYRGAAEYLKSQAASGEIVVHADWDDFPPLFYWDDAQRYIMGLDPTFMFRENAGRYHRYVDFTLGDSTDPVGVMNELGSRWVYLDRDHLALKRLLDSSGSFVERYRDAEGFIYELK
jgi:hypothetical protein